MEFASEMIVKASLYGLNITEVPTTLSVDGRSRRPYLKHGRSCHVACSHLHPTTVNNSGLASAFSLRR